MPRPLKGVLPECDLDPQIQAFFLRALEGTQKQTERQTDCLFQELKAKIDRLERVLRSSVSLSEDGKQPYGDISASNTSSTGLSMGPEGGWGMPGPEGPAPWLPCIIKESNAELLTNLQELLEPLLTQNASKADARAATKEVSPKKVKSREVSSSGLEDAPKPEKALEAKEVMPVILSEAPPPEPEAAPEDAGETTAVSATPCTLVATTSTLVGKPGLKPGRTPAWLWQQRGLNRMTGGSSQELGQPPSGIDWFMGNPLDVIAGVLIAVNTAVSYVQLDWAGYKLNLAHPQLGTSQDPDGWPGADLAFDFMEYLFCAIFLFELILRLWYFRCTFFLDKLNILDGSVVLVTSLDTFIISNLGSGGGANLGFIRIIRYCKLVRTLRFVRAMQLCSPLRVLIRTILSSFGSLFWSMVILFAFQLMSSLFLCQTLQGFIADDTMDSETRIWLNRHYGSATKALWTMTEITFSGGWPGFTRKVIENCSPLYAIPFFIYIAGVVFAVIRIITALFLKDTLAVAANDQEMMMQQKAKDKEKFARKLREVFEEADESGDGTVCWEEFQGMLNNPKAKASLSAMELESHEVESLFQLLDDGDGTVSFDEFLKGVVRLKGQARSQDVLAILHDSRKVLNHVMSMEKKLQMLDLIEEELDEFFPEGSALIDGAGSSILQDTAEPEDTNAAAVM